MIIKQINYCMYALWVIFVIIVASVILASVYFLDRIIGIWLPDQNNKSDPTKDSDSITDPPFYYSQF